MIRPEDWTQITFTPSFRRLACTLWTSPAAIARAQELLDARDTVEAISQAVLRFHGIASHVEHTTPLLCEAMSGLDSVREVLHTEICELRRANEPPPTQQQRAQWRWELFEKPQACDYPTASGGWCTRTVRGIGLCEQHRRLDAELTDEKLNALNEQYRQKERRRREREARRAAAVR